MVNSKLKVAEKNMCAIGDIVVEIIKLCHRNKNSKERKDYHMI